MRKLFSVIIVGAGLVLAQGAHAGALLLAQLTFALGTLPPATFVATYTAGAGKGLASGSGAAAAWSAVAGAIPGGTTTATIPSSAAPPITQIQFIVNGNPANGAWAASADATVAVTGQSNIKAFGGLTLLGVPLVVGQPTTIQPPVVSGIGITGLANNWTTKTTTVNLLTPDPGGPTKATRMGANNLVNGGGTVVLVSALNVITNVAGQLPSFAVLLLQYAPDDIVAEPGTLLLVGSGIAGLVAIGRKKIQK
jgi:hypothetical protein